MPSDTKIDMSTSINDLLAKLVSPEEKKPLILTTPDIPSTPIAPPTFVAPPTPAAIDSMYNPFDAAFANVLPVPFNQSVEASTYHHFDDILSQWTNEILRIEGKFRHHLLVKDETFMIIDRMLQDGLISTYEHGNLTYINRLFIRLHDLIHMNISTISRREIIEILANLFEMGKLTKTAFIELCVNI